MEIRPEDEAPLRRLATDSRRSVRDEAGYLLALKIREEADRLDLETAEPVVDSVAA